MGNCDRPPHTDDLLYEWGNDELTERHQKGYLVYLRNAPGNVLEIGSGRGVMLRMMREAGIKGYGIDASEDAVKHCRENGLDAVHGDAIAHLASLPPKSLGGMFCGHVIEHMQPARAVDFIQESCRVLKSGARLVIITPNAKDLRTTERFWLDTTHVRPYPEKLLVSMLKRAGFVNIKTMEDKEPARNFWEKAAKFFLRAWFMGFMYRGDLVVVAERGGGVDG